MPLVSFRLKVSACCGMPYTCSTPDRRSSVIKILPYTLCQFTDQDSALPDQDSHWQHGSGSRSYEIGKKLADSKTNSDP